MGQLLSVRARKAVGCDTWSHGLCSQDNVSGLIDGVQGCLDVHRKGKIKEDQYYDYIDGVSYLILRKIGSGEYSNLYEASRTNTSRRSERYAVKVYRSRNIERQKRMREEVRLLEKVGGGCREIVQLHRHQESGDPETGSVEIKMILDLCTGGSLRQLLKTVPFLEEHKTRIVAFQIIQALHYLHTRRIMHCDVKPENILFVDAGSLVLKLSDFGNAKMSHDGLAPPRSNAFTSSDIYVAPEILQETSYGTPVDMWALGIALYQCLTGRFPFQNGTKLTMEVVEEICSGTFIKRALSNEMFPECVSFNAFLFLEKLLRVDPNERMNVVEALNHKWLKSAEVNELNSNQIVKEVQMRKDKRPMLMRPTDTQRPQMAMPPPEFAVAQKYSTSVTTPCGSPQVRSASSHSATASSPSLATLKTTSRNPPTDNGSRQNFNDLSVQREMPPMRQMTQTSHTPTPYQTANPPSQYVGDSRHLFPTHLPQYRELPSYQQPTLSHHHALGRTTSAVPSSQLPQFREISPYRQLQQRTSSAAPSARSAFQLRENAAPRQADYSAEMRS